ncbi:MAG: hypothetical protein ABGY29_16685 [bacterium]
MAGCEALGVVSEHGRLGYAPASQQDLDEDRTGVGESPLNGLANPVVVCLPEPLLLLALLHRFERVRDDFVLQEGAALAPSLSILLLALRVRKPLHCEILVAGIAIFEAQRIIVLAGEGILATSG